jgi:hypothetical protein
MGKDFHGCSFKEISYLECSSFVTIRKKLSMYAWFVVVLSKSSSKIFEGFSYFIKRIMFYLGKIGNRIRQYHLQRLQKERKRLTFM